MADDEAVRLGLIVKIGFFASGLLFGRWFSWPSRVCKNCAESTSRVGELAFCLSVGVLIIGGLVFAVAKWHVTR
jgi:hypothetical protein